MIKTETIGKVKKLSKLISETPLLEGIEIVRCTEDGDYNYLRSILLRDKNGREIEIIGGDSSNRINIVVPKSPEFIDKFALEGKVCGLAVKEIYNERFDADEAKRKALEADDKAVLEVTPIQIEI